MAFFVCILIFFMHFHQSIARCSVTLTTFCIRLWFRSVNNIFFFDAGLLTSNYVSKLMNHYGKVRLEHVLSYYVSFHIKHRLGFMEVLTL